MWHTLFKICLLDQWNQIWKFFYRFVSLLYILIIFKRLPHFFSLTSHYSAGNRACKSLEVSRSESHHLRVVSRWIRWTRLATTTVQADLQWDMALPRSQWVLHQLSHTGLSLSISWYKTAPSSFHTRRRKIRRKKKASAWCNKLLILFEKSKSRG